MSRGGLNGLLDLGLFVDELRTLAQVFEAPASPTLGWLYVLIALDSLD